MPVRLADATNGDRATTRPPDPTRPPTRPTDPTDRQVLNGRIHGLSVSRTFGDLDSKTMGPGVVCTPQV